MFSEHLLKCQYTAEKDMFPQEALRLEVAENQHTNTQEPQESMMISIGIFCPWNFVSNPELNHLKLVQGSRQESHQL